VEPPPAGAGGSLQERDLPRIPHSSPGGSRGIPIRRDGASILREEVIILIARYSLAPGFKSVFLEKVNSIIASNRRKIKRKVYFPTLFAVSAF
jgi:hypothetical protein